MCLMRIHPIGKISTRMWKIAITHSGPCPDKNARLFHVIRFALRNHIPQNQRRVWIANVYIVRI